MIKRGMIAALAALLAAGCAATPTSDKKSPAPYKEIPMISGIQLPANAVVIGQVHGADTDELKDKARAMGGDAITPPQHVGMMGGVQTDVIQYR